MSVKATSLNRIMSRVLKIDSDATLKGHTKYICGILRGGGVIAFPTDTYYGLGVNPFNIKGVRRVFDIKSRQANKPLLVLVSSEAQLDQLVKSRSREANLLIKKFWPAPLTLIFNAVPKLPHILTAGTGTVGIRLPGNKWTRQLIEAVGCPLTATSANKNNETNLQTAEEVAQTFESNIDLILDAGPAPGGDVSTLIDTTVSPPVLLRHGAVTQQEIESNVKMECTSIL